MNVERAEPGTPQWRQLAAVHGAARFTGAVCRQPITGETIRWDG